VSVASSIFEAKAPFGAPQWSPGIIAPVVWKEERRGGSDDLVEASGFFGLALAFMTQAGQEEAEDLLWPLVHDVDHLRGIRERLSGPVPLEDHHGEANFRSGPGVRPLRRIDLLEACAEAPEEARGVDR
jgi:hypothetical protein